MWERKHRTVEGLAQGHSARKYRKPGLRSLQSDSRSCSALLLRVHEAGRRGPNRSPAQGLGADTARSHPRPQAFASPSHPHPHPPWGCHPCSDIKAFRPAGFPLPPSAPAWTGCPWPSCGGEGAWDNLGHSPGEGSWLLP